MDKSYFIELLRKYIQGVASEEECQYLLAYYDLFDTEPDVISLLSEDEKEKLKEHLKNDIWTTIEARESRKHKSKLFKSWIVKSMAAAAICITSITYFIQPPQVPANINTLTETTIINVKKNQFVHLPDGSTVIVNAGSRIGYPISFDSLSKREVYLEGQAYFDVKHNPDKPFIVHSGELETTVLGTAFNIKAWSEDQEIAVTVVRGKVKVDDSDKKFGVLVPDQQLTYRKKGGSAIQHTVNANDYLLWQDKGVLFDNVTVEEMAEFLEKQFKVIILIKDGDIRLKRFTTTFLKNETLAQVLKSICEFNNAVYDYDEKESLVVIRNKEQLGV